MINIYFTLLESLGIYKSNQFITISQNQLHKLCFYLIIAHFVFKVWLFNVFKIGHAINSEFHVLVCNKLISNFVQNPIKPRSVDYILFGCDKKQH